ncbi:hypothetical protein [Paenibacillus sp. GCM10012303]|uniref:LexA family protein n=1 Tax=Paenibacillus sp. GCM10012303 TaxID=3317340 RepID=UPI00360FD64C
MPALTANQQKTLDFIRDFIYKNNYSPTFDEIARGIGLRSRSVVYERLLRLQDKGLVDWDTGASRTIRLIGADNQPKYTVRREAGLAVSIDYDGNAVLQLAPCSRNQLEVNRFVNQLNQNLGGKPA